ncbi:MAG: helix-turn-helix domain-containing protein [Nanoarchaeota archaeon]
MPLGNLTSQFFANIYLNELDQFVKKKLRAECYIRYVDDFVILHESPEVLQEYKQMIDVFLKEKLALELHPSKCKILNLDNGVDFLGFRIFYHHKLLRKKNLRKFERVFEEMKNDYSEGIFEREEIIARFEGWFAYANNANTYKYCRHYTKLFDKFFPIKKEKEIKNVVKHEHFVKKIESINFDFSPRKTLQLFKKGLKIKEIAEKRQIKEGTVWSHFAKLIEANQFSIWKLLPKEKIILINSKIKSNKDTLKEIKSKVNHPSITYDEINCVLASIKSKYKEKTITELCDWYQKAHCYRKCHDCPIQRKTCKIKFDIFVSKNPNLLMKRKDFLNLFNNQMTICILPQKEKEKYITWQEFKIKSTNNTTQNSVNKPDTAKSNS